jgi:hypothetical protein
MAPSSHESDSKELGGVVRTVSGPRVHLSARSPLCKGGEVDGEEHDFEAIWYDISSTLWQAILAYSGGRRDVADDALAEAFARAIHRDGQVRDPRAYLYRVAFRIASNADPRPVRRARHPYAEHARRSAATVYGEAGYVYNAHLSAYGTFGKMTTGTIIGYVGNSGDASNSASHDHFEWHPGNGAAVDPFPYLNAVCLLPSETTNETPA